MLKSNQRLRKSQRITSSSDYRRVYALKLSAGSPLLVVYVAPVDRTYPRLGLSVSRKVGSAVVRNYVRRRIREAFRRCKAKLGGVDVVCIARPAASRKGADVEGTLVQLVHKALARQSRA